MANVVLYRKYRPTSFAQVIGQEPIVQTLRNAVTLNLFSHAYLFVGPRGSGKTTLARLLAKALNCEKPIEGDPCNKCQSCTEINEGRAIDLIEIDAASNRGIDEIRDLKEGIRFAPTHLKYKVFVIDEAHQLTKEAANALLKTLEEPPSHTVFILATTELHKMIPTIVSRCQRFDFRKFTVPELVSQLQYIAKKEGATIDKAALSLIAARSGGAARDAISLLDTLLTFQRGTGIIKNIDEQIVKDLLGIVGTEVISEFVGHIIQKEAGKAVELLNKNLENGMDPLEFTRALIEYLHASLLVKVNPILQQTLAEEFTKEQQETIVGQAKQFEQQRLTSTIEYFLRAEQQMKFASIIQLPLELAIIDACGSTEKETSEESNVPL